MSKLYPCVYCTEDGYCKKFSDKDVISWCDQSPCKDEKPSHADRIRAMSDEELAELWWERVDCGECPVHRDCKMTGQDCKKLALGWLKQEAAK